MPNGRTSRLAYYVSWSLTRLKRVGLVDNSQRGVWSLTERGQHASYDEVPALWEEMQRAYREAARDRPEPRADGDSASEQNEGTDDWKDALLDRMKALEPAVFERLCQRLLREAGFEKVSAAAAAIRNRRRRVCLPQRRLTFSASVMKETSAQELFVTSEARWPTAERRA